MSGWFAVFGLEEWAVHALNWHAKKRGWTVGVLVARVMAEWLRRNPVPEEESPLHPSADGLQMASPED